MWSRWLCSQVPGKQAKLLFLKNEEPFKNWHYINLDDLDTLSLIKRSPLELLSAFEKIVIDEVQKAPEILPLVKNLVDSNKNRRFVLSGSANLLLLKEVTETLAGRSLYFPLFPFARQEWEGQNIPQWFLDLLEGIPPENLESPKISPVSYLLRGFMPRVLEISRDSQASLWWEGYVKTYLERDLRDFSHISYLGDFKKLLEVLAINTSSTLNESRISENLGMSQPTVHRYINLLEASFIYWKLRPFYTRKTKQIVKSPKGYFVDPGLTSYLSGYSSPSSIPEDFKGKLFENMIFLHLQIMTSIIRGNLYFFQRRGKGGTREVDFVLEKEGKIVALEAKINDKIRYEDCKGLISFLEEFPETSLGLLIYSGDKVEKTHRRFTPFPGICFADKSLGFQTIWMRGLGSITSWWGKGGPDRRWLWEPWLAL